MYYLKKWPQICIYYRSIEETNWRLDLAKTFERPKVIERYELTDENIERF